MMNNRLHQDDCMEGYLLDGFPRTLPQAQGLDFILEDLNQSLNRAVNLTADSDELIRRLILRGQKSGRDDDSPDVIRKRQQVYWNQTAPLIDYYRKQQILIEVNGIGEISEITHRIIKSLT
jgi:adenylate kinase